MKTSIARLGLLPLLALPACTRGPAEIKPVPQESAYATAAAHAAPLPKVFYDASWAEYCKSIGELKAHGDFAVAGTVSSISPAVQHQPDGVVYSTVTLDVERTLWSQGASVPATVSFVETGGTYQGVVYGIKDDPNYEVGDRVIAFFKEYSPGKYRVAGGPTGRFGITGGVVKPMVKDGVPFAGEISETGFAARVQNE